MHKYDEIIAGRLMKDLMADFDLTRAQAAGIVGNLAHESAGFKTLQEISPVVAGSRGGYGYAQWTGKRRKQFEAFAKRNELDPTSYDANYGFLAHELSNEYRYSLAAVKKANNSSEAAKAFSEKYEYPGIPHLKNRYALARDIEMTPKVGFQSPVPLGKGVIPRDVINKIATDYGPLSGDMTTLQEPPTSDRRMDERHERVEADRNVRDPRDNGEQGAQDSGDCDPIADIIERSEAEQAKRKPRLGLDPNLQRLLSGDLSALDPENGPFSPNLLRMLMGGKVPRVKGATRLHDIARPPANRFGR